MIVREMFYGEGSGVLCLIKREEVLFSDYWFDGVFIGKVREEWMGLECVVYGMVRKN